jgi:phosphoribosylamine--glycine ligase
LAGLDPQGATVFHAGTARNGPDIVTAGGRVLGITGRGATLAEAQASAYRTAKQIAFEGCHYRQDIAFRALASR